MLKACLKGAITGGIVVYLWMMISWCVLPWHYQTMNSFSNEEFVGWVIKENVKKDGLYVYPSTRNPSEKKGPTIFSTVNLNGIDMKNPFLYIKGFLIEFAAAWLVSLLLLAAPRINYAERVFFVTGIGLFAGIVAYLPHWNWSGSPLNYTLIQIADLIIAWFFAGLIMAKVVSRR